MFQQNSEKCCPKSNFPSWWPWPLTIKPTWDIVQLYTHSKICVCTSNGSHVRVLTDGHRDCHIDGTDSITLTADERVNNIHMVGWKSKIHVLHRWLTMVHMYTIEHKGAILTDKPFWEIQWWRSDCIYFPHWMWVGHLGFVSLRFWAWFHCIPPPDTHRPLYRRHPLVLWGTLSLQPTRTL